MNDQEKDLPNWEQATFKNSVIFAWIVSEHPEVCLELLQLILPELAVTEIFEVISEYTQKASLKNQEFALMSILKMIVGGCLILKCKSLINMI